MKQKLLGALTPVLFIGLLLITAIIVGAVVGSTSSDGWAALGAIMMVFIFFGLLFVILVIIAIVLYIKTKSLYWQWFLYSAGGMVGLSIISGILISLYNSLV